MNNDSAAQPAGTGTTPPRRSGKWVLFLLLAVCIAPVLASYGAYYWLKPDGRTNYGDLIAPQVDANNIRIEPVVVVPPLPGGRPLPVKPDADATLAAFNGRWVMVVASSGACDEGCRQRLYKVRQVRLTTGKHRDRVERLWLLTDNVAPSQKLLSEYAGSWVARIDAGTFAATFAANASDSNANADPQQHIFLIDPLGHLMMRFPVDADPSRMKKDLSRLLKASRIG